MEEPHGVKGPARDGVTEKRISEQRPKGGGRHVIMEEQSRHRGLSSSEGFGGCPRKPAWQELREGVESRNKGRRRPGATGALTAPGALLPRKQEGGHMTANVVPAKWTPAAPSLPGNELHTTHLPGTAHGALPRPRNPGAPVSSPPSGRERGLKGTLVDTCLPPPWAPRRAY